MANDTSRAEPSGDPLDLLGLDDMTDLDAMLDAIIADGALHLSGLDVDLTDFCNWFDAT